MKRDKVREMLDLSNSFSGRGVWPRLIVVTGAPGSGKSTLARLVSQAVRCPAICRDEIKEGLIHTIGETDPTDPHVARHVASVFFETVERLLDHNITIVAEAAFQHKVWAPRLELLRDKARLRIIVCQVNPDLLKQRIIRRSQQDPHRSRFHNDQQALALTVYDPPRLKVPTLMVDTSDGYRPGLEDIVTFARD